MGLAVGLLGLAVVGATAVNPQLQLSGQFPGTSQHLKHSELSGRADGFKHLSGQGIPSTVWLDVRQLLDPAPQIKQEENMLWQNMSGSHSP